MDKSCLKSRLVLDESNGIFDRERAHRLFIGEAHPCLKCEGAKAATLLGNAADTDPIMVNETTAVVESIRNDELDRGIPKLATTVASNDQIWWSNKNKWQDQQWGTMLGPTKFGEMIYGCRSSYYISMPYYFSKLLHGSSRMEENSKL
jgi:hypothetical protein